MIDFFKKRIVKDLPVDIHSHLIPGIDDGVDTMEEALGILQHFIDLGYKKIITTPHIHPEFYPNNASIIAQGFQDLQKAVMDKNLPIQLEFAAEYFLGEELWQKSQDKEELLTFGDKYLLFECSFLNEPFYLKEFIFNVVSQGYKPVLAHPERYAFVHHHQDLLEDLKNRGVLFQINANSLLGHYTKIPQKIAEKLIKNGMVDFIGSDCHNIHHIKLLKEAKHSKSFQKALDLPLLNYQL